MCRVHQSPLLVPDAPRPGLCWLGSLPLRSSCVIKHLKLAAEVCRTAMAPGPTGIAGRSETERCAGACHRPMQLGARTSCKLDGLAGIGQ